VTFGQLFGRRSAHPVRGGRPRPSRRGRV